MAVVRGTCSQMTHISTPPFSVTSFSSTKMPVSKTASGGSGRARTEHRVPIVCTGQTRDTNKLTTTPAAPDHDTMTMCTDTKRTGIRTNPAIIHSVYGLPSTPPPDRAAAKTASELPPSPAKKQQKVPPPLSVVPPQTVYTELGLQCQTELVLKLKWCTSELEKSQSLEHSILICRLITAAGEALKTMMELPPLSSPTAADIRHEEV